MGMRCSDTAVIYFDDVRVPAANIIGKEGVVAKSQKKPSLLKMDLILLPFAIDFYSSHFLFQLLKLDKRSKKTAREWESRAD